MLRLVVISNFFWPWILRNAEGPTEFLCIGRRDASLERDRLDRTLLTRQTKTVLLVSPIFSKSRSFNRESSKLTIGPLP